MMFSRLSARPRSAMSGLALGGALAVSLFALQPAAAKEPTPVQGPAVDVHPDVLTDPRVEASLAPWQESFNALATSVSANYPSDYADSAIQGDGTTGWIGFTGAAPQAAKDAIFELPNVDVREGLGFTAAQVDSSAHELFDAAIGFVGEDQTVLTYRTGTSTTINVELGGVTRIESNADGVPTPSPPTSAEIAGLDEYLTSLALVPEGFALDVTAISGEVDTEADGSEALDAGGPMNGVCSTSFPVKRNGGSELGILTAGHCPGTGTYRGKRNAFNSPYPYSLLTTDQGAGGDFRWNWSKDMLTGATDTGEATARRITGSADPSSGATLCHYGMTTGYKCSTVARTNVYVTIYIPDAGSNVRVGPLRGTLGHLTAGGDSGGSWFFGSTGYGIHSGVAGGSVFSSLPNALSRLGVSLFRG